MDFENKKTELLTEVGEIAHEFGAEAAIMIISGDQKNIYAFTSSGFLDLYVKCVETGNPPAFRNFRPFHHFKPELGGYVVEPVEIDFRREIARWFRETHMEVLDVNISVLDIHELIRFENQLRDRLRTIEERKVVITFTRTEPYITLGQEWLQINDKLRDRMSSAEEINVQLMINELLQCQSPGIQWIRENENFRDRMRSIEEKIMINQSQHGEITEMMGHEWLKENDTLRQGMGLTEERKLQMTMTHDYTALGWLKKNEKLRDRVRSIEEGKVERMTNEIKRYKMMEQESLQENEKLKKQAEEIQGLIPPTSFSRTGIASNVAPQGNALVPSTSTCAAAIATTNTGPRPAGVVGPQVNVSLPSTSTSDAPVSGNKRRRDRGPSDADVDMSLSFSAWLLNEERPTNGTR